MEEMLVQRVDQTAAEAAEEPELSVVAVREHLLQELVEQV
jgi:predicted ArsR family transcriptional regulator